MPINIKERMSHGWRLRRLMWKLEARQADYKPLYERYENTAPMPEVLATAPEAAKAFFKASRTDFAEMVVKAGLYPLRMQSVSTALDSSDVGDSEGFKILKRAGLFSEAPEVHRHSYICGNGYAMVGLYENEPAYTCEDPRQVVTMHDPVRQQVIIEGAKRYWDDSEGREYIVMYHRRTREWPNGRMWRAYHNALSQPSGKFTPATWDWDDQDPWGGVEGVDMPHEFDGEVPFLRYRDEEGVGEFQRHIDVLDRIDHIVLQGMVIATLQAFKQRAIHVSDEDLPEKDEQGNDIDYNAVFTLDPGALWKLPETAKMWESGAVDGRWVWEASEKELQKLSAVTFTPLSMYTKEGQNQAAEGARFAREARTMKVEDRQDRFGAVHERAAAMLFHLAGEAQRADVGSLSIVWRPAERYSLQDKADALVKYKAGGVPWRTRMIVVGQFTPAEVERMATERMADEVLFGAEASGTAAELAAGDSQASAGTVPGQQQQAAAAA